MINVVPIAFNNNNDGNLLLTVLGSSRAVSISAWRRNTLPRQTRHSICSKAGMRSRWITPATNLNKEQTKISMKHSPLNHHQCTNWYGCNVMCCFFVTWFFKILMENNSHLLNPLIYLDIVNAICPISHSFALLVSKGIPKINKEIQCTYIV